MKVRRHIVLYVASAAWDITVCWPAVLLVWLFWGTRLRWEAPPHGMGFGLWCDLKEGSWPARTWYRKWGGTTLGHGGFYNHGYSDDPMTPNDDWEPIEEHENVHVEQYEASMLRSLLVGILFFVVAASLGHPRGGAIAGVVMWWAGYLLMGTANWGTAWLRGESPYRGSHHEEAAYNRDELYEKKEG